MSYYEPKRKMRKEPRTLVSDDLPEFLKKHGITKLYCNLAPSETLDVSKQFAVLFHPEILKHLKERKLKKYEQTRVSI